MGIKHAKTLTGPDGVNPDRAQPSDWNDDLIIDGDVDFDGHAITDPADPTAGTHVGDRDYNDARYDADGDAAAAQAAAEATAAAANTADIATHAAIVDSHHAKYLDAEAVAAVEAADPVALTSLTVGGESLPVTPGTWTPELAFSTPGDFAAAYSVQEGYYTRIGNIVVLEWALTTSSFTFTTASGTLRITGLPFTVKNTTNDTAIGSMLLSGWTGATYATIAPIGANGNTYMNMQATQSGGAISNINHVAVPTTSTVICRGTLAYLV